MLTGWFRNQVAEKVDILGLTRKSSTPGEPIPETVIQSQVECIIRRQGEDTQSPPVTTRDTSYRCYLIGSQKPEVSQIVKRDNGERLTILTKPERFKNLIFFDCQHKS